MVMALEEAFDIEIPDEAAEEIKTVKDAVTYIDSKVWFDKLPRWSLAGG